MTAAFTLCTHTTQHPRHRWVGGRVGASGIHNGSNWLAPNSKTMQAPPDLACQSRPPYPAYRAHRTPTGCWPLAIMAASLWQRCRRAMCAPLSSTRRRAGQRGWTSCAPSWTPRQPASKHGQQQQLTVSEHGQALLPGFLGRLPQRKAGLPHSRSLPATWCSAVHPCAVLFPCCRPAAGACQARDCVPGCAGQRQRGLGGDQGGPVRCAGGHIRGGGQQRGGECALRSSRNIKIGLACLDRYTLLDAAVIG